MRPGGGFTRERPGESWVQLPPGPCDTVAERRGVRLQSALTAVRVRPVSLA